MAKTAHRSAEFRWLNNYCGSNTSYQHSIKPQNNRGYAVGVASRLATVIYIAMVMPILYDNSYSPNNSNLKYESYWLYG